MVSSHNHYVAPGSLDTSTGCPLYAIEVQMSSRGKLVVRGVSKAHMGSIGSSMGCQPRSSGMRNEALFLWRSMQTFRLIRSGWHGALNLSPLYNPPPICGTHHAVDSSLKPSALWTPRCTMRSGKTGPGEAEACASSAPSSSKNHLLTS